VGQSAGSAAVYHTVNSPLTKGLIHAAVAESGIRDPYNPMDSTLAENYHSLTFGYNTGVEYLAYKNVTTIAQLRQLPMGSLIDAMKLGPGAAGTGSGGSTTKTWVFGTTLDYYAVPDTYLNTLNNGPGNDVPLITGNTKDESGASTSTNLTVAQYIPGLQTKFGNSSYSKVLDLYPAANSSQADMSYNAYYRDTSRVSNWLYATKWKWTAKSPIDTYY
jgi:carboxylesterase 2